MSHVPDIPVWEKVTLTIAEASKYSNIGINTMQKLLKDPRCPFVLRIGRKYLVKRKEFEKYLLGQVEI